jgi:hypothetical protein
MAIALTPRPAARRHPQTHPLAPVVSLGVASALTLLLATGLAALVPETRMNGREGVAGPVRVLPAVQVIAQS